MAETTPDRKHSQSTTVTIVVPTHKRPKMLRTLLQSLRLLEYRKGWLELIVVGTQRDPGKVVVETFSPDAGFRVTYLELPDSKSTSASFKRNEGARAARADILAFTDDDCVVDPNWVVAGVPFFDDPAVGGVEGYVEIPEPAKPTLTSRGSRRLSLPGGYQTCNMFFRKSVFLECGGFDPLFPYYLEDTDLAYTIKELGYRIPFATGAIVMHPVQPGQPLKLLAMAKTVERMPYLFSKHAPSNAVLRSSIKPFNRSHYVYLGLYGTATLIALLDPLLGIKFLGVGVCMALSSHLLHDFWGLQFTLKELALTAVCQPIVPVLRVFYWLKGLLEVRLARKRTATRAKR